MERNTRATIGVYVLDTNAIYYLADGRRTKQAHLRQLARKTAERQIVLGCPPVALLELGSALVARPRSFHKIRLATLRLQQINAIPLPDPATKIREIITKQGSDGVVEENCIRIISDISRASAPAELSALATSMKTCRDDYEKLVVDAMVYLVNKETPDWKSRRRRGRSVCLRKDERKEFKDFFAKPEWPDLFAECKAGQIGLNLPRGQKERSRINRQLTYFRRGWELLFIATLCGGRFPGPKNKNDVNDLLALLYLTPDDGNVLVSSDRSSILGRFAQEFPDRCLTYEEFRTEAAT